MCHITQQLAALFDTDISSQYCSHEQDKTPSQYAQCRLSSRDGARACTSSRIMNRALQFTSLTANCCPRFCHDGCCVYDGLQGVFRSLTGDWHALL